MPPDIDQRHVRRVLFPNHLHVPEIGGVPRMIDGGPIPDDDHKARGTAAERHLGLRLFRVRIRHAA